MPSRISEVVQKVRFRASFLKKKFVLYFIKILFLQMIKMVPKFNGENFAAWTRSLKNVPRIAWPFLNVIISGLERPESTLRGSRKGEGVIWMTAILILVM